MPRREDQEVHKRTCGGIGKKKLLLFVRDTIRQTLCMQSTFFARNVRWYSIRNGQYINTTAPS